MDTDGIGSAVQQIIGLAQASKTAQIIAATGERKGSYYIVGPDGNAKLVTAGPDWHRETLETPNGLVDFIKQHGPKDSEQAVFVAEEQIVYVRSLNDRRDVAVCPLRLSPQYQWLKSASAGAAQMKQADLVRLLRITFRGCLLSDNILPLVRNLKFENGATGNVQLQHGRESMGRQVLNAVTGVEAIPEEIGMNVPVFENYAYRAKVQCALEVFPAEGTFRLTPYPMEVGNALDQVIENVIGLFDGDDLPTAYRGKP